MAGGGAKAWARGCGVFAEDPQRRILRLQTFFKKVCHRLSLGAYIHLVKLVARTEASSSALRFRVSRRCFFCGVSHKGQERWEDMSEGAFLSLPRKKNFKIFCHRRHRRAYSPVADPIKSRVLCVSWGYYTHENFFCVPPCTQTTRYAIMFAFQAR